MSRERWVHQTHWEWPLGMRDCELASVSWNSINVLTMTPVYWFSFICVVARQIHWKPLKAKALNKDYTDLHELIIPLVCQCTHSFTEAIHAFLWWCMPFVFGRNHFFKVTQSSWFVEFCGYQFCELWSPSGGSIVQRGFGQDVRPSRGRSTHQWRCCFWRSLSQGWFENIGLDFYESMDDAHPKAELLVLCQVSAWHFFFIGPMPFEIR